MQDDPALLHLVAAIDTSSFKKHNQHITGQACLYLTYTRDDDKLDTRISRWWSVYWHISVSAANCNSYFTLAHFRLDYRKVRGNSRWVPKVYRGHWVEYQIEPLVLQKFNIFPPNFINQEWWCQSRNNVIKIQSIIVVFQSSICHGRAPLNWVRYYPK